MKQLFLSFLLISFSALACGPSPQKVVEKVTIQATAEEVWALVGHAASMQKWHPKVKESVIQTKQDSAGKVTTYRTLTLEGGGELIERIRPMKTKAMKLGVVIEKGNFPVSNYSDALTVKPGIEAGTAVVTWTGRFNNQANLLVAPKGKDNEAAIAAVTTFYTIGLSHLKQVFSKQSTM